MILICSLVLAVYCHYLKITQASIAVKCVFLCFELYWLNKHRTNLYIFTPLSHLSS